MSQVFANMFVLLVAPPGVGKSVAIRAGVELWNKTRVLKVAPDDVTKASLLDTLGEARRTLIHSPVSMDVFHSLLVGADELGVFLPAHDLAFLNTLNILYDNRPFYKESRRHRPGDDLDIENPQITILAGTQPDYMASIFPPEAWGMGFMTRIIMVHHGSPSRPNLFGARIKIETNDLLVDLKSISDLHGEMGWTDEAERMLVEWHEAGMPPVPDHIKLKNYINRRALHAFKLCMISSVSRTNSLMIEAVDVRRAMDWLIEAEGTMPDVFKDMGGKSDGQVIQDLHYHLWQLYIKEERKALHRARIDRFLSARTPAYNIENIVRVCVSSGVLIEKAPNYYVPGDPSQMELD